MNFKGEWQDFWSAVKYYFYPIKKLQRKCAKDLWSHILIIANPWHKTPYSYIYYELEQKSQADSVGGNRLRVKIWSTDVTQLNP
jgi:hypothetical protein